MKLSTKLFIAVSIAALLVVGCNTPNSSNSSNAPKDSPESLSVIREAADQGNADAQYNLGVCYYNGDGVEQDYTEAVKWWQKAADQGHESAINALKGLGY